MKPQLLTILICGLLLTPVQASWARKWTDNTGKFSIEAELVEFQGDKVVLKKTNGTLITLSVERMSDADRQYLDTLAQKQTTEPVVDQAVNLVRNAKYTASSTWDKTTYTAAKAFDGRRNTRWNSRRGDDRGAWLAVHWDKPVTIRRAVVRQAFDRITGLKLQVLNDTTKPWQDVFVLDGEQLKRQKRGRAGRTRNDGSVNPVFTIRLDSPVRTKDLRLLITSVMPMQQGTISVFEFEAFGQPAEHAPEVMQSLATLPYLESMRANLSFPDAVTKPPTWNDANPPFDVAEFFQFPPAEENAATLYLDALCEFSTDMDSLLPDMPLHERKQWMFRNRNLYKEYERLNEAWEKDPQSVDYEAVNAWVAHYDLGFEKLAAAQQRPKCVFQTGRSFSSLIPHAQVPRQVSRVVEWRTRRNIISGDLEQPLQDIKTLLRLTRDLQVRGGFVTNFVALAVDGQCCQRMRTVLNAPGIDVGHCDRLLALLAEHQMKATNVFLEGNRAEYIFCRQALHDLQHRTGAFDPKSMKETWGLSGDVTSPLACFKIFADLGGGSPQEMEKAAARLQGALLPGAWRGGKMLSDEDYAAEVEAVNRCFAKILALAEQPNFWHDGQSGIKAAVAPVLETTLAGFLIPAESAAWEAIRRSKAQLRGTQCLVALRRWQLEHAETPPNLETIVRAAGMPGVPLDPYSDQPLRMGSVAGKPVIYSVGPDGKDDQAKVEWNYGPRNSGDFIFQLEKPTAF